MSCACAPSAFYSRFALSLMWLWVEVFGGSRMHLLFGCAPLFNVFLFLVPGGGLHGLVALVPSIE